MTPHQNRIIPNEFVLRLIATDNPARRGLRLRGFLLGATQLRTRLRGLAGAAPGEWRAALRGRSEVLPCRAHPAAIPRLAGHEGVLLAGLAALRERPFDLAIAEHVVDQVYVDPAQWSALSHALAIRPAGPDHPGVEPNLTVLLPRIVWPFPGRRELPDSVLAADLLDSAEPRAVRAGAQRLDELLKEHLP
jgi:hypothetical protein